jgi:hypothetical protein
MNEALKNEILFRALTSHHKNKFESIESSFKQFFSRLKACDRDVAHVFLTGVTPEFTSGFNISEDLALNENFEDLYGFKKCEIEFLLDKALGNDLSCSCIIRKQCHG